MSATAATETTPGLRPGLLVELLTGDAVLRAARKLLDAEIRLQRLRLIPATERGDTSSNGQPYATAAYHSRSDGQRAADELAEAVRRVALRIAREEATR